MKSKLNDLLRLCDIKQLVSSGLTQACRVYVHRNHKKRLAAFVEEPAKLANAKRVDQLVDEFMLLIEGVIGTGEKLVLQKNSCRS